VLSLRVESFAGAAFPVRFSNFVITDRFGRRLRAEDLADEKPRLRRAARGRHRLLLMLAERGVDRSALADRGQL
jgi:hypothetical protein